MNSISKKRVLKRMLSILLAIMMVFSMFAIVATIPASAFDFGSNTVIYYNNSSTNWDNVYFNINGNVWNKCTDLGNGFWKITYSSGYNGVNYFYFENTGTASPTARTASQTRSDFSTKNCFTPSSSSGTNIDGSWGTYTAPVEPTTATSTDATSPTSASAYDLYVVGNGKFVNSSGTATWTSTTTDYKFTYEGSNVYNYSTGFSESALAGTVFSIRINTAGSPTGSRYNPSAEKTVPVADTDYSCIAGGGSGNGSFNMTATSSHKVVFHYNTSTNKFWYTLGDTIEEYKYVNTELFNYLYDTQLNNDPNDNYSNNNTGDSVYRNKDGQGTNEINRAISDYMGTTTSGGSFPLYFGTYWQEGTGSARSLVNFDTSLLNPYMPPNSANRWSGSMKTVAQGLVDSTLNSSGNLTQTVGSTTRSLPYFDKGWFDNHTSSTSTGSKKLANYYDTRFPMNISTDETTGIVTYGYDSATDQNRYYDPTIGGDMRTDGSNIKNSNGQGNGDGDKNGYFAFSKNSSQREYAFGTKISIEFYVSSDGKIKGTDGTSYPMTFSFGGDDDVWVYIDDQLALDMGGAHQAATGNINFANGTSNYTSGAYNGQNQSTSSSSVNPTNATTVTFSDGLQNALGATVTGSGSSATVEYSKTLEKHTMTFFYMERGFMESNMVINYNLLESPQASGTQVTNKIGTDGVNVGLLKPALTTADSDLFQYAVNGSQSTTSTIQDAVVHTANSEDFVRNNTDSGINTVLEKSGLPYTTGYSTFTASGTLTPAANSEVKLADSWNGASPTSGIIKSGTGANVLNMLYNQSGEFSYLFAVDSAEAPSKVQIGQANQLKLADRTGDTLAGATSTRLVSQYYTTDWALKNTTNKTVVNKGTAACTTVSDTAYVQDDTSTNMFVNTKTNDSDGGAYYEAVFENQIKTHDITITKAFESGITDTNAEFTFTVGFDSVFGGTTSGGYTSYSNLEYQYKDINGFETTKTYGTGITLKAGETAVILGVPVGTKYKITEASQTGGAETYALKTVGDIDSTHQTHSTKVTGEIAVTGEFAAGTSSDVDDNIKFTNGSSGTYYTVTYYYHPRVIQNGVPTVMDNTHYYSFTKTVNDPTKQSAIEAAPNISNVLDDYTLTDSNITVNTDNSIIAYYTNTQHLYNINYTIDGVSKTLTKTYNELVTAAEVNAGYNSGSTGGAFMYWSELRFTDPVSGKCVWTPISSQFKYQYRVTGDITIRAVYQGDTNPITGQAFAPTSVQATASQTAYDFYTADKDGAQAGEAGISSYVTANNDRVRANLIFGTSGCPDTDTSITEVGYVRINQSGSYNTSVTSSAVKTAIDNGTVSSLTSTPSAVKMSYNVTLHQPEGDPNYPVNTTGITLTNKNRANFVFDMQNKEGNASKYYTIYTYMVRGGTTYVSAVPAYISLNDALAGRDVPNKAVSTTTVAEDHKNVTAGTLTADATGVKVGDTVKFTATALDYVDVDGITMYPVFDYMIVDGVQVTSQTYHYTVTSSSPGSINAVAYFKLNDKRSIVVTTTSAVPDSETGCYAFITAVNGTALGTPVTRTIVSEGDVVTLSTTAGTKTVFDHWDDGTTTAIYDRTISTTNNNVVATFALKKVTVTAAANNSAYGTVKVNNGTASATASATFNIGETATLDATANTGYRFDGWYLASDTEFTDKVFANASATLGSVNEGLSYVAKFIVIPDVTISATADPTAGGTVQVDSNTAGSTSSGTVVVGNSFTLTAAAATGYDFSGWYDSTDTKVGSSTTYTATAGSTDAAYTAKFTKTQITITVAAGSHGSVSASGGSKTGTSITVDYGTTVTITATPATYYNFSSWSPTTGLSGNTATATLTATTTITYTASFAVQMINVYFTDTSTGNSWGTPQIHYWGGTNPTTWGSNPSMTYVTTNGYDQKIYTYSMPADNTGIVFRNSVGTNKTADITTNIVNNSQWYLTSFNSPCAVGHTTYSG